MRAVIAGSILRSAAHPNHACRSRTKPYPNSFIPLPFFASPRAQITDICELAADLDTERVRECVRPNRLVQLRHVSELSPWKIRLGLPLSGVTHTFSIEAAVDPHGEARWLWQHSRGHDVFHWPQWRNAGNAAPRDPDELRTVEGTRPYEPGSHALEKPRLQESHTICLQVRGRECVARLCGSHCVEQQ